MFERGVEVCLEQASAGSGERRDDVVVDFVLRIDVAFQQQQRLARSKQIVERFDEILAHAGGVQVLSYGVRPGARGSAENRMQKERSDEQSRHRSRSGIQGEGMNEMVEFDRALFVARGHDELT